MSRQGPITLRAVFAFCLLGGGLFGSLSGFTISCGMGDISAVVIGSVLAFPFGLFVGLLCSPIAVPLLRGRDRRCVPRLMFATVSPVVVVLSLLTFGPTGRSVLGIIDFWELMIGSGVWFILMAAVLSRSLRRIPTKTSVCYRCEYDLRGSLEMGRCPECGEAFDVEEVRKDLAQAGEAY